MEGGKEEVEGWRERACVAGGGTGAVDAGVGRSRQPCVPQSLPTLHTGHPHPAALRTAMDKVSDM